MNTIKKMATRTRVEGLVILLVTAGYLWETHNVPSFYKMPGVPGPTIFPALLGIIFGCCGLWLLFSPDKLFEGKQKAEDEAAAPTPSGRGLLRRIAGHWHLYTMWIIILGYMFLMPLLGFPVATFVLLAVFFYLLGEKRWAVLTGLALIVTAVIYGGFALGLHVRLPLGILAPLFK